MIEKIMNFLIPLVCLIFVVFGAAMFVVAAINVIKWNLSFLI
jgi:hypothetical protein